MAAEHYTPFKIACNLTGLTPTQISTIVTKWGYTVTPQRLHSYTQPRKNPVPPELVQMVMALAMHTERKLSFLTNIRERAKEAKRRPPDTRMLEDIISRKGRVFHPSAQKRLVMAWEPVMAWNELANGEMKRTLPKDVENPIPQRFTVRYKDDQGAEIILPTNSEEQAFLLAKSALAEANPSWPIRVHKERWLTGNTDWKTVQVTHPVIAGAYDLMWYPYGIMPVKGLEAF